MQIYSSSSGCRNHSALVRGRDTHSSALGLQTQHWQGKIYFCRRVHTHTGTGNKEQAVCPLFIKAVGSAPFLGLVELGFTMG
jgi:hypothetical protein